MPCSAAELEVRRSNLDFPHLCLRGPKAHPKCLHVRWPNLRGLRHPRFHRTVGILIPESSRVLQAFCQHNQSNYEHARQELLIFNHPNALVSTAFSSMASKFFIYTLLAFFALQVVSFATPLPKSNSSLTANSPLLFAASPSPGMDLPPSSTDSPMVSPPVSPPSYMLGSAASPTLAYSPEKSGVLASAYMESSDINHTGNPSFLYSCPLATPPPKSNSSSSPSPQLPADSPLLSAASPSLDMDLPPSLADSPMPSNLLGPGASPTAAHSLGKSRVPALASMESSDINHTGNVEASGDQSKGSFGMSGRKNAGI
uniref:Uncharacterized protein n=1 Tax=Manihot esculenta TaxID=3983 RepID=A0A2C9VH01_MANES